MTVFTDARYGFAWNYAIGDSGWGANYNFMHRALGALLFAYVLSDTLTAPPSSPVDGDTYSVAASPTGAWAGQAGKVASYQGGVWQFYVAPRGFRCYIASRTGFFWWTGVSWQAETSTSSVSVADVSGAAPLASPAFTGTPTAPTPTALSGNTQLATTLYVDNAVAAGLTSGFAGTNLSGLPTSDPGGGKPWLNGGVLQVGS